jgi:RHS repeat-associated protein
MDYTPFGVGRSFSGSDPRANLAVYGANAPLKQQYTGQERDGESGLDFMQARYYPAWQGRFLSPDGPLVDQSAGDLGSWNLYGYGRSNPISKSDPTGRTVVVCFTGYGCFALTDEQYLSSFENNPGVVIPSFSIDQINIATGEIFCNGNACGTATYVNDSPTGLTSVLNPAWDLRDSVAPFDPRNWWNTTRATGFSIAFREAKKPRVRQFRITTTRKVKDKLPEPAELKTWNREQLEDAAEDLEKSIAQRVIENAAKGGDRSPLGPAHRKRIEEERVLLRAIRKTLSGS